MPNESGNHPTVDNIVYACMDFRFRPMLARWIKEKLGGQADLVSYPGGCKAFNDKVTQQVLLDPLDIAVGLHRVTTVHLLNHRDCGAYGGSGQHQNFVTEERFHEQELARATAVIKAVFPMVHVRTYLIDFDGIRPKDVTWLRQKMATA